ncbi:transcriptional regulator NrdR [Pseudothermotoga thermarum]|uniref:Transcriptional repressor NrdR n=1 Tax=Pseudothermotoga thermarum DSM 5069 TaxID=688269 RepID=F7YVH1_9THEM|nr:transcriptional regulator NrdR [Pseudothermotoga thermarum]AEH50482.1 ATP-cone domain protein [Pseudothermotoga thermarum DSM 5069]
MKCPFCGALETRVLDSRPTLDGTAIRRRRECIECGGRFTTYERYESLPIVVVKKDGRREAFDRKKILNGLLKACEKRPVPYEALEKIVEEVELAIQRQGNAEVQSKYIGELVMEKLKQLDQVAYVRFASVYKDFREIDQFLEIVKELKKDQEVREGGEKKHGLPNQGGL